jgi:hypothetical protein
MKHDYTPEQALRKLIEKLTSADAELLAQVLAAVNAGKDVQEVERTGRKQSRFYRHTVQYSPEEALQVALEVLRAHFIEQPLFRNVCHDNMKKTSLGTGGDSRSSFWDSKKEPVAPEAAGAEKAIEIELQTETEIIPGGTPLTQRRQETLTLARASDAELTEQQGNFDQLQALVDFTEK